ncbi:hypothetical protein C7C46_23890 [Streptomyces tateyamensis]|uniref:Pyrrolo-quinoline quinone repeat domain-containing protein n=1 Tax=Streptomyces tateyamensis TaxID=565073 RepID=A0A2V4NB77_9ACTN|nr:PQQ-binding-like beta-propeller repeat protein [Streptomyces tateyamensis]PYC74566.1 hypothetical protein C7C46_23890 [Streptomyces tateyamensis]
MTQDGYGYQHSWYPGTDQQPQPGEQPWQWQEYPQGGYQEQQYQPATYVDPYAPAAGEQPGAEQYNPGQYNSEQYSPEQYSPDQHRPEYARQHIPEQYASDQYQQLPAEQATGVQQEAEPAVNPVDVADPADPADPRAPAAGTDAEQAPTAPRSRRAAPRTAAGGSLIDRARDSAKAAAQGVLNTEGGPGRRALLIRAGAGVAALGVLITAGIVATSGHSDHPAPVAGTPSGDTNFAVAHNRIWVAQPAAQQGTDDTLVGSWLLGDAVVRADSTGVHAYQLADGKPGWSIDAPAQGAVPCGLSPTVNGAGLGGALFRTQADPKSPCTLLAAVDTKAGKTAWTKKLSDTANSYAAHVAVTEDKVIAVGDDKVQAWAGADGKDAWQYGGQGKFCTLTGSATGATVLVDSNCADSNPGNQLVALGAADGKVLWAKGLDGQPKTVTVLSAEPAAVLTTGDQPADSKVLGFAANGDATGSIPLAQDGGGQLDVGHGSFDPTPGVFFQDHSLVTTLTGSDGATSAAAFDLAGGKALWRSPVSEKGGVRAVALDGGALVLATEERVGLPAHLSRFALTNGQESIGGGFPRDTGSLLTAGRVLIGGGRVVAVPEHSTHFGTATAFQAKG